MVFSLFSNSDLKTRIGTVYTDSIGNIIEIVFETPIKAVYFLNIKAKHCETFPKLETKVIQCYYLSDSK